MMKRIVGCLVLSMLILHFLLPVYAAEVNSEAGGIHILKTDLTGNALEGAVFQVVRTIEEEELADHAIEKKMMKIGEENKIVGDSEMTYIKYRYNSELMGDPIVIEEYWRFEMEV